MWDVRDLKPDASGASFPFGTGAVCSPVLARLGDHTPLGVQVAFSPDGQLLAMGGGDGTVRLWDVPKGKLLAPGLAPQAKPLVTLRGHTGAVFHVAFSPDGKYLASAGQDTTVRLWDVRERRPLATLRGHIGAVNQVAFGPDGKILASASTDGTVRLWFSTDTPERRAYRWHLWREEQAEAAESSGQWFAAAFHLGELLNQDPANKSLEARWNKAIAELAKIDKELADRAAAKRKFSGNSAAKSNPQDPRKPNPAQ